MLYLDYITFSIVFQVAKCYINCNYVTFNPIK